MADKVVKRKIDKENNPQAHKGHRALKHLTPADYMAAGQTSFMDASITPEQRERFGRPSNVKGSSSGKGDNRRVSWNANTYVDKGDKGKGKSSTPEEREGERERLRRWERDNH